MLNSETCKKTHGYIQCTAMRRNKSLSRYVLDSYRSIDAADVDHPPGLRAVQPCVAVQRFPVKKLDDEMAVFALLFEAWGRNADALVRNRRFLRRSSRSILGLTGDERIVRAEAALIADGGVRVSLFLIATVSHAVNDVAMPKEST